MGIYQSCRTPQQITFEFDQLQQELETEIGEKRTEAREQLLNNFDQEVIERVRIASTDSLNRFEAWLWKATRFFLEPYARFEPSGHAFTLLRNPFSTEGDNSASIHPGPYRMGKRVEDANTYRIGHPLAQRILDRCKPSIHRRWRFASTTPAAGRMSRAASPADSPPMSNVGLRNPADENRKQAESRCGGGTFGGMCEDAKL